MPKQVIRENSCTFDEICLTLKQYGYSIYTKDDVYLMHFNFLDFLEMKHKLKHTKSVFIYQLSYPVKADEIEFCQEVLGLDDFLGKWLIVNYWADWCPPCIKEMPELESFYIDNKQKALVLTYNFDRLLLNSNTY